MRRRVIIDPRHSAYLRGFADAMRQARAELARSHFETTTEILALRREVDELRELHTKAVAVMRETQAQERAHAEHRERARERALLQGWAATRDFGAPVH